MSHGAVAKRMLDGVRVLDLSRVLAGPYCCQVLGDLGADVIKIERPGNGDDSRTLGPPFLQSTEGEVLPETPMFLCANRNKRSITANLSSEAGVSLVKELAAVSDVIVENYKVGDLARRGLGYEAIKAINPRIIYCSVTGFGQEGPYKDLPGYDAIFQAMSGLMSVTGFQAESGAVRVGVSIGDIIGGLQAAIAILGALNYRNASGKGQHIDLSLLDSTIASVSHLAMSYLMSGVSPQRRGNEGAGGLPSGTFRCVDGFVTITAGNDGQYDRLCQVMGRPDLRNDPRFLTNPLRLSNRDPLMAAWTDVFSTCKVGELVSSLRKVKIPIGPVNDLQDVFRDPHVRARGLMIEVPHERAGTVKLVGNPARYSETPIDSYRAPPELGRHTEEILLSLLGKTASEVNALRQEGVI